MPTFESSGFLRFDGNSTPTTLTPNSNFSNFDVDYDVFDNGDNNADSATDYVANNTLLYSGFTISINSRDYAIFNSGSSTTYYVPYFDAVEDLSGLGGTAITQTITQSGENASVVNLCFVTGTLIATPTGERAVEDLAIGDLISTADGRTVPVKWLGRQQISRPVNVTHDDRRAPVCIAAGTLGNHSDLFVSADHGMIVSPSSSAAVGANDGLVINAAALVNGSTIRFVPAAEMPAAFTYYHVETQAHDIILANGAPAESFIDMAGRKAFDNHQEYLDLYGAEPILREMPLPRIAAPRLVPQAIKDRLGTAADTTRANAA